VGHVIAFTTVISDAGFFDILMIIADTLAHTTIFVLVSKAANYTSA
jgi:hypothetical protein